MAVNAPAVRGRGDCSWDCCICFSSKVGESRWYMELPMLHVAGSWSGPAPPRDLRSLMKMCLVDLGQTMTQRCTRATKPQW